MSFAAAYVLSEVFVSLIVPLAIVAARRRVNGPLTACAAIAIVSFAGLWLLSSSQGGLLMFIGPQDGATSLRLVLYAAAAATAQAAWVLAVYQAAMARHARWLGGLAAAQVIANAVLLLSASPCIVVEITNNFSTNGCAPLAPLTLHLISAAWLISPAIALAYALRTRSPRPGSATSHASAPLTGQANADDELELRTERL
ncbi:MAG TPA: hypothetical protein VJQ45_07715 [Ktedonobacterales bacterium]|nr:hypothetical protein [Ktedonobacterales bacterium]